MKQTTLAMFLLSVCIVTGCSSIQSKPSLDAAPTITVPTLNQVKIARVSLNSSIQHDDPAPLLPNVPSDKVVIQKLLGWLQTAKPEGYENPQPPMPTEGPTTLEFQLTNGNEIMILPAMNCTTTRHSIACKGAQNYVDFQYADNSSSFLHRAMLPPTKMVRLQSPELDTWLLGKWQNDMKWPY